MNEKYLAIFNDLQDTSTSINNKEDHVLIFDGLNLFLRIFSAVPTLNDNGDHVGGVLGFLKSLAWTIRQFNPTRCIIVFDGVGGSSRRRKLYPEYKSNRINKTKFNRYDEFKDVDSEQESMKIQMIKLIEYISILPLTSISIDMVEADDVIAYLSKSVCQNKVTIVSTDKDFLQLVDNRIQVWRPTTKKLYTETDIEDEYNIHHKNFLLWRLFEGDNSDNIPGVQGIGRKTLIKQFPELKTKIISYEHLISLSKDMIAKGDKKKIFSSIVSNEHTLKLNEKLMQLHDVEISGDIKKRIRDIYHDEYFKTNHFKFRILLVQDRFNLLIKDIDSWIRNSFGSLDIHAK